MSNKLPDTIYLIPDDEGYVWCDEPAPSDEHDASEAVEYVRANQMTDNRQPVDGMTMTESNRIWYQRGIEKGKQLDNQRKDNG